jgi:predicted DNA-binding protein YlxM (UPF0122 family)
MTSTVPSSEEPVLEWLRAVCTQKQFEAAELYYSHDLGVRQIARRLEVAPATISDRLDAVKLKLVKARRDSAPR